MERIKIDKDRSLIEIESEGESTKNFIVDHIERWNKDRDKFEEEQERYKKDREKISHELLAFIVLLWFFLFTKMPILMPKIDDGVLWNFVLGLFAGLIGLWVRNIIFMSNGIEEKKGKNLYLAYLAYFIFLSFSSLLIFEFFREKTFILIPLNFYAGLVTYQILDVILSILGKLVK